MSGMPIGAEATIRAELVVVDVVSPNKYGYINLWHVFWQKPTDGAFFGFSGAPPACSEFETLALFSSFRETLQQKWLLKRNFFAFLTTMTHVGGRVRALRTERQLTLPALAQLSGLSKGLLSKLENAQDANPSVDTLYKVAEALKVTVADLVNSGRVQVLRIVPDTAPPWLEGLTKTLRAEGTQPDEDILQALYVLQSRKSEARSELSVWVTIYRSLEMSFARSKE